MPRDVTPSELAILHLLWDGGPASRRQLTNAIYPGGGPAQYATVQKLLERLEAKGYVRHDPGPGTLIFTAAVGRDELISRRLLDVADQLCGGAVAPLLTNLIQAKSLTPGELAELRALIERLRPSAKPKGKPR
jgi:predicted transcriptional regulator